MHVSICFGIWAVFLLSFESIIHNPHPHTLRWYKGGQRRFIRRLFIEFLVLLVFLDHFPLYLNALAFILVLLQLPDLPYFDELPSTAVTNHNYIMFDVKLKCSQYSIRFTADFVLCYFYHLIETILLILSAKLELENFITLNILPGST